MARGVSRLLCGLLAIMVLLAVAHARDQRALDALAGPQTELSWRQNEILVVRARVHGCQRELGRSLRPVAQRIIAGGPAYRRWVLRSWRRSERLYCGALRERTKSVSYWAGRQIWAADILGRESAGDPWPNCPDPYDGGGYSWHDTVACENGGQWLDSPGYYRCGLQFDPMWERRFGRLCP